MVAFIIHHIVCVFVIHPVKKGETSYFNLIELFL